MPNSVRFKSVKLSIFLVAAFTLFILVIVFSNGGVPHHPYAFNRGRSNLQELKMTSGDHPVITNQERMGILDSVKEFDSRVRDFFHENQCRVQIFMTWIAPVDSFRDREFASLQSLFHTNPNSCLIILSTTMDSKEGQKILDPLIDRGFCVKAMTPDLCYLLKNTPAEDWINSIKNGERDPGKIPLAQNLSNLIRLAVVYKYGGAYFDTDFIVLKDVSGLRNSIGAQTVDTNGNWTRLNNAVLIFDKNHPLVYKFMEEFARNYDGNIWGHNGPYLVSRVVSKVVETGGVSDFTILPPMAFYPVDWTHVAGFFNRPTDHARAKWVDAKVRQLRLASYGVHLWNSRSTRFEIEDGSIVGRLISQHCATCSKQISSSL